MDKRKNSEVILYRQCSKYIQSETQHRSTRTLPVEGSAHDNERAMVCAEYGNTEGSPNLNG
jgi:hypothetical protein